MKSTVKHIVSATAGLAALAFLGFFAKGVISGLTKDDDTAAGESDADFADGDCAGI